MTALIEVGACQADLAAAFPKALQEDADGVAATANSWILRLHAAFYGNEFPKAGNKFQLLEKELVGAFQRVIADEDPDRVVFWRLVVELLLQLATRDHDRRPDAKKKLKGKAQSSTPLAFVVVNSLRTLIAASDEESLGQECRRQGESNAVLRKFCLDGMAHEVNMVSGPGCRACAEGMLMLCVCFGDQMCRTRSCWSSCWICSRLATLTKGWFTKPLTPCWRRKATVQ